MITTRLLMGRLPQWFETCGREPAARRQTDSGSPDSDFAVTGVKGYTVNAPHEIVTRAGHAGADTPQDRTMVGTNDTEQRLASLMRFAQDGNAPAYVELLQEVAPLLRRAVRHQRRFLQPQDVEDLVQDV